MNDHPSFPEHGKSVDAHIDDARAELGATITRARAALAPYRADARFSLKLSLHAFHRALQEPDGTWTKGSLLEILDTLNEAFETRLWLSADGVFLPYPGGPREVYRPGHSHHAFDRVIRIVIPVLVQIARIIADAAPEQSILHTSAPKAAWRETAGLLRRIGREVREEVFLMEYEREIRETARLLLPPGRHLLRAGRGGKR